MRHLYEQNEHFYKEKLPISHLYIVTLNGKTEITIQPTTQKSNKLYRILLEGNVLHMFIIVRFVN